MHVHVRVALVLAHICRGRGHGEDGSKSGPDGVGMHRKGKDWWVRLWDGPCGCVLICGSAWQFGCVCVHACVT